MVERQLRKDVLVGGRVAGGGLLLHRQLLAVEQDLADLLRRAEVERAAGDLESLLLLLHDLQAELVALALELRRVEQHAVSFHALQHRQHRHLDVLVDEPQLLVRFDLLKKNFMKGERAVRNSGGVLRRARNLDGRERDARCALPGDFVQREQGPAAVPRGEHRELAPLMHLQHIGLE
jgi:hypothetical protein